MRNKKSNRNSALIAVVISGCLLLCTAAAGIAMVFGRRLFSHEPEAIIDGTLFPQQERAFEGLVNASDEQVSVYTDAGIIRSLNFQFDVSRQDESAIIHFIDLYKELFEISDPSAELILKDAKQGEDGFSSLRFTQAAGGVPVYGADLIFQFDAAGNLVRYSGGYAPQLSIATAPAISVNEVEGAIATMLGTSEFEVFSGPELIIFDGRVFGSRDMPSTVLVWKVGILKDNALIGYLIDAHTGGVVLRYPVLDFSVLFNVYDAERVNLATILSAANPWDEIPIMDADGPIGETEPGDNEAIDAFNQFNQTVDYFERNGYRFPEGEGGAVSLYVNVDLGNCPTAAWLQSERALLFCDDTTESGDMLAHELTHAVTNDLVGFAQYGGHVCESCALNEAFSDIFAMLVDNGNYPYKICLKDCVSGGLDDYDLVRDIGLPPASNGTFYPMHYGDMMAPGDGGCTSVEADAVGCGHFNSTIFSHAVYLMLEGGQSGETQVEKIDKAKVERIMMHTLLDSLMSANADLKMGADAVGFACQRLIGSDGITPADCDAVQNAFAMVGIGTAAGADVQEAAIATETTSPEPAATEVVPTGIGTAGPASKGLWMGLLVGVGVIAVIVIAALSGRRRVRVQKDKGAAYLLGSTGAIKGERYPLQQNMLIGRGAGCQIVVRDLSISRRHAQIVYTQDGWVIKDLGSTAGTHVNGKRVETVRLRPGDKITLGESGFTFMQ